METCSDKDGEESAQEVAVVVICNDKLVVGSAPEVVVVAVICNGKEERRNGR